MTQRLSGFSAVGSLALASIVAGTFVAYGCGDDEPITPGTPDAATHAIDAGANSVDAPSAPAPYHYVTKSLVVGPMAADANARAFDVDGSGTPKNKLGGVLLTLGALGFDVDTTLATAVDAGGFVVLHSLKASSLTTAATATWQIFIGDPKADPDLTSGSGTFTVASSSPTNAILNGAIAAGTFTGGPSTVTLQLTLVDGAPAISIPLHNAHIEADVTAAGCTAGRLGGGVTVTDLNTVILPALVDALNARIAADGTCSTDFATCTVPNQQLLTAIDRADGSGNSNNHIELGEITGNVLISTFLLPDIDILDASGAAGHDSTLDSLSIAVGFECTKAVFTAPSEQ